MVICAYLYTKYEVSVAFYSQLCIDSKSQKSTNWLPFQNYTLELLKK